MRPRGHGHIDWSWLLTPSLPLPSGSHVTHHAGAPANISADNKWLWRGGESEAGAKIVRNILCTLENKGSEGRGWDERSMSSFQFQKWFRQLLWQRNGVHQSVLQRIQAGDFNFMITWSGQWQGWADIRLKIKEESILY